MTWTGALPGGAAQEHQRSDGWAHHASDLGGRDTEPIHRQAHNLKVPGSNPGPATNQPIPSSGGPVGDQTTAHLGLPSITKHVTHAADPARTTIALLFPPQRRPAHEPACAVADHAEQFPGLPDPAEWAVDPEVTVYWPAPVSPIQHTNRTSSLVIGGTGAGGSNFSRPVAITHSTRRALRPTAGPERSRNCSRKRASSLRGQGDSRISSAREPALAPRRVADGSG